MKHKWWNDKIAYQIYPKSFLDTNGDGIGDLRGIISKLDYLQDLGIDIIWLSPIYCSPLADQGYDISDYYNIDPRFGTMEDMEELLREAKKRQMYILMDLVVNHCSDEHIWFQRALKEPEGEYGKFFYIEKGKHGTAPNNLRSYFGGSAWDKIPDTDYYYLHLFHKKQPDLNWENPRVREEIYTMINWWLDKGLAGFRIDAIMNIKKELPFRDYQPDRADGMVHPSKMLEQAQGIGVFLSELRDRTFRPHDAFTVGEVFNEKPEELQLFIGDDGYFSSMFDFNETIFGASEKGWYDNADITPNDYRKCCFAAQRQAEGIGLLSNIIENHDEPRGVSRYITSGECSTASKKCLATAYFFLKGIPFIYQGQEIGMENTQFHSIDEVDDIATTEEYRVALEAGYTVEAALHIIEKYSRDNARTPFQWNASEQAGFTTGVPWLQVNPNYQELNLAAQQAAEQTDSVYQYYKKLTALRKHPDYSELLTYGGTLPMMEDRDGIFAYYRKWKNQKILVAVNLQNRSQKFLLEEKNVKLLLNTEDDLELNKTEVILHAYQAVVLEMKS